MVGEGSGASAKVSEIIERAKQVEAAGLDTAWIAEIVADATTVAALVGQATERVEVGTSVVPIPMRHPYALAHQASTTDQACDGRFSLGIGLSHKVMVESVLGMSYEKPLKRMREFLDVLQPMLAGEGVDASGDLYSAHLGPPEPRLSERKIPTLIAALGPQMLRLAGQRSEGTITWASGLKTLESHIVPTIHDAAKEAGNATPRVVVGLPVVLTSKPDEARERAAKLFGHYRLLPSYRAMMDREGVEGIEDLAVIGDEASVREQLARYAAVGTSDLCVFPYETEAGSTQRTLDLLGDIARGQ